MLWLSPVPVLPMKTLVLQNAERDLAHAETECRRAVTALQVARGKLEAARKRVAHLQYSEMEVDREIEVIQREMLRNISKVGQG